MHEGADGELYRSWSFRYKLTDGSQWGKLKGLGSIEVISLAAARKLHMARALAKVRNQPWDPVGESRKVNAESKVSCKKAEAASVTFSQCAEKFMEAMESKWTNPDKTKRKVARVP